MRIVISLLAVALLLAIVPATSAGREPRHTPPHVYSYDIQGICHIDMKRGPDIEGVVLLGRVYECALCLEYWDCNGFYFTHGGDSSSAILFDRYYRYISTGKIADDEYRDLEGLGTHKVLPEDLIQWPQHEKAYFLYARQNKDFVPFERLLSPEALSITDAIDSSVTPRVLRRDVVERFPVEYDLLEHIPVYPTIPDEVAVRTAKSVKPILVPLREIRRFRILMNLSERWTRDIAAARNRASKRGVDVHWLNASSLFFLNRLYSPWENYPLETRPAKPFDVEAVCRIETLDSQTVIGAVSVARDVRLGEYEYLSETDGLYIEPRKDWPGAARFAARERRLWDLFQTFYLFPETPPERGMAISGNVVGGWCWTRSSVSWPEESRAYYLKDVTIRTLGKCRFRALNSEIINEDSATVLKREVVIRYPNVFEMLDSIPVYREIPEDGSLRDADSIKPTYIAMRNVKSLALLSDPPDIWWTYIARSQIKRPWESPRKHYDLVGVRWLLGSEQRRNLMGSLKPSDGVGFARCHRTLADGYSTFSRPGGWWTLY